MQVVPSIMQKQRIKRQRIHYVHASCSQRTAHNCNAIAVIHVTCHAFHTKPFINHKKRNFQNKWYAHVMYTVWSLKDTFGLISESTMTKKFFLQILKLYMQHHCNTITEFKFASIFEATVTIGKSHTKAKVMDAMKMKLDTIQWNHFRYLCWKMTSSS